MTCVFCEFRIAPVAQPCPLCADGVDAQQGLCPEEVEGGCDAASAWLIDPWRRAHGVRDGAVIGRAADISVRRARVSRKHASLIEEGGEWWVVDLGSANGTYLDGVRVEGRQRLGEGAILRVDSVHLQLTTALTPASAAALGRERRIATEVESVLREALAAARSLEPAATPLPGLTLIEAPSGDGGVLRYRGEGMRFTALQFELVRTLLNRYRDEAEQPADVRGWVRSIELLSELPWATARVDDVNLRHLVRRVRGRLAAWGFQIEASHGLGYRLPVE
jgi:hypothetical protein